MEAVTAERQPITPTRFLIATDILLNKYAGPINILFGFSTEGDIYAAEFPTKDLETRDIDCEYWSSYLM